MKENRAKKYKQNMIHNINYYGDINKTEKKTKYINGKLSKLKKENNLKKLDLKEIGMVFVGNSLNPSAM